MTQEEKQLLMRDLCARLPYGVKVNFRGFIEVLHEVHIYESVQTIVGENGVLYDIDMPMVMPYLRPMESMTEEEEKEYENCFQSDDTTAATLLVDFYNKRHLDYRGLIKKGLALEAPEDMYKME